MLDLARARSGALEFLDNVQALSIGDLAKDDVLAVQPGGDNGGDEELRTVGIGTGIGHGEHTRLGMGLLEVLVCELLTVDRLATRAISTSEVATLQHELRNDSVERAALVAEAFLTGAEGSEVLGGFGDYVVVEFEVDPSTVRGRRSLTRAFGIRSRFVEGSIGPLDVEPGS